MPAAAPAASMLPRDSAKESLTAAAVTQTVMLSVTVGRIAWFVSTPSEHTPASSADSWFRPALIFCRMSWKRARISCSVLSSGSLEDEDAIVLCVSLRLLLRALASGGVC